MGEIQQNIIDIEQRITAAAQKSGRKREDKGENKDDFLLLCCIYKSLS